MRPRDFETGKIYLGNHSSILVKVKDNKVVGLSEYSAGHSPMSISGNNWSEDYAEICVEDLNAVTTTNYKNMMKKYFPEQQDAEPEGCTCDMQDIMTSGCKCGWLEKERS